MGSRAVPGALAAAALLVLLASAPAAEAQTSIGGYVLTTPGVAGSTSANYAYAALFNPSASGKTVVIQRLELRVDSTGPATAIALNLTRINASSGGTLVVASQIPKKITTTVDSIIEVRHTGPAVTISAGPGNNSRIAAVLSPTRAKDITGYKEIRFENDEKLILGPGEGVAFLQEAAGDVDFRVRLMVEWTEESTAPAAANEYMAATPLITTSATANYSVASLFNPSGSGRTLVVKRLDIRVNAIAAAVTIPMNISRINASSGGDLMGNWTIPRKNNNSAVSVAELRYNGPTVTLSSGPGNDSRLAVVQTPGAAGNVDAYLDVRFRSDEKLILQPGEGIVLIQEGAADTNLRARLMLEWAEETTVPSAGNEFMLASPIVPGTATAHYVYASLFNPTGSGKQVIIKRVGLHAESISTTSGIYFPVNLTRINASSGGSLVSGYAIPRKHNNSPGSVAELRHAGPTVTISGGPGSNSRLLSAFAPAQKGPGKTGELSGKKELRFEENQKLILQPGEGIAFFQEVAGTTDYRMWLMVEWQEEAVASAAQDEFIYSTPPVAGFSGSANYAYATLFNPLGSGKAFTVKRFDVRIDCVATAGGCSYIGFNLSRITAASGGTNLTGTANRTAIQKNNSSAETVAEIRHTGPTVTLANGAGAASRIVGVTGPGAAAEIVGWKDTQFNGDIYTGGDERIILQPGEGIALMHEAAADPDHRVRLLLEWEETSTTPTSLGDYMMTTPVMTGSTSANFAYASIFNPSTAVKSLVIKRLVIRVDAVAATASIADLNLTRITSASGGTLIPFSQVPKKHTTTNDTDAEIRYTTGTSLTVTYAGSARISGVSNPGDTGPSDGGEIIGHKDLRFKTDTKLYLLPGQGVALAQEATTADAGSRIRLELEYESDVTKSKASAPVAPWSGSFVDGMPLVHKNETITMSVFWEDNIALDNTSLEWNATVSGADTNVSFNETISGASNWSNFTNGSLSDFMNVPLGVKQWRQFANDTSGNLNNSSYGYFQLWGWANITNLTPFKTVADGYYVVLECRVRDHHNASGIAGYNVSFYNNTTGQPGTVFLGSNFTNSTGSARLVWNTTNHPLGTFYPTCVLEAANTTLFYNASEVGQANGTVILVRQLAISASYNLSQGIQFGGFLPPQTDVSGTANNNSNATELAGIVGAGNTSYYVNVSVTSTVNVTLCISTNDTLRLPGSSYTIPNSGYTWNSTARHGNGTWKGGQPGNPPGYISPSDSGNDMGTAAYETLSSSGGSENVLTNITLTDQPDNATLLFRFWLDIPASTFADDYYNTVSFKGVRDVDGCGSYP